MVTSCVLEVDKSNEAIGSGHAMLSVVVKL